MHEGPTEWICGSTDPSSCIAMTARGLGMAGAEPLPLHLDSHAKEELWLGLACRGAEVPHISALINDIEHPTSSCILGSWHIGALLTRHMYTYLYPDIHKGCRDSFPILNLCWPRCSGLAMNALSTVHNSTDTCGLRGKKPGRYLSDVTQLT